MTLHFNHARSLKVYCNFHIDINYWSVLLHNQENIFLVDLKFLVHVLSAPLCAKHECPCSLLLSYSFNIIAQNKSLRYNAFCLLV